MRAERMEDFIKATAHLHREADFVAAFPFPFLVRERTRGGAIPVREDRATARLKKAHAPIGDGFAENDVWIHRVRAEDPERGAVLLGREERCDVQIEDGSVSAEHARFTQRLEGDERAFFVADVGSSNGTWLNGERLASDVPTRLSDQDSLRFGPGVKVQFFTAAGFFHFLDFYRRIKK